MKNIKINKKYIKTTNNEQDNSKLKKFLLKIIQKTLISVQKYKNLDIIGTNEFNICIKNLEQIFRKLNSTKEIIEEDILIRCKSELIKTIMSFGTEKIKDLIELVFGKEFLKEIIKAPPPTYNIIHKCVHPIGYKLMTWDTTNNPNTRTKKLAKNRIVEDFMIVEIAENWECFDLARTSRSFQTRVYGIKIALHNKITKQTMIICGVMDNIPIECTNDEYIINKIKTLKANKPNNIKQISLNDF